MLIAKKISTKKLSVLPGYVLVEPVDQQQKTVSGIYLPDSHDEKPQQGKVLAISPSWTTEHNATIKCPVKIGNMVLYKKWGGSEVQIEDKEFQFLKYEDILAVIN